MKRRGIPNIVRIFRKRSGQATVEYLLVIGVIVAEMLILGLLFPPAFSRGFLSLVARIIYPR